MVPLVRRLRPGRPAPRAELDAYVAARPVPLTVLVPVTGGLDAVRRTLWSAALQEYPDLRVVLLLDEPPQPSCPDAADRPDRVRGLVAELGHRLDAARVRVEEARTTFELSVAAPEPPRAEVVRAAADLCRWAAGWLEDLGAEEEQSFGGLADALARTGRGLLADAERAAPADESHLRALHRRLSHVFGVEVSTWDRRRHLDPSRQGDALTTVDAFRGLVGRSFRTEETMVGRVLFASAVEDADLVVPQADLTLAVEPGSMLPREYCLRLGRLLQRTGREAAARHATYRGDGTEVDPRLAPDEAAGLG